METTDWNDALCVGKTDLFFSMDYEKIRRAELLCLKCPRLEECKIKGKYERAGVWGGKLRGWPSESLLRNYSKWLKKHQKIEDEMVALAEKIGVDVEQFRRVAGL